jgi:recombination protein RecT
MGNQLAQRVSAQRGGQNGSGSGEVEQVKTLAEQIRKMQPEYQAAMPKGMEAAQLVRDAITCLRTVKNLDRCEPMSVLGALMTTAQLGLRPAVLGHAWPLPFYDNRSKGYKAQLVIGYQGYVELGYRSGKLAGITSRIVYTNDEFDVVYYADRDELVHKPAKDGLRTDIRCFYSAARLNGGGYSITDPMSLKAMEAYREEHAAARDRNGKVVGPWVSDFAAMGQKTMVRINFKLLPKSPEMAIAMEADDGVRINLEPEANAAEVTEHPIVAGQIERDEPAQAEALDSEDPWSAKVSDITTRDEASAVVAEVTDLVKNKKIDGQRANTILAAVNRRVADMPDGNG